MKKHSVLWTVALLGFLMLGAGCGSPDKSEPAPSEKPPQDRSAEVKDLEQRLAEARAEIERSQDSLRQTRSDLETVKQQLIDSVALREALHKTAREHFGSVALVRESFDKIQKSFNAVLAAIEEAKKGNAEAKGAVTAAIRNFVIEYEFCLDSLTSLEEAWETAPAVLESSLEGISDPEGKLKGALAFYKDEWKGLGKKFVGWRWVLAQSLETVKRETAEKSRGWLSDEERAKAFQPSK